MRDKLKHMMQVNRSKIELSCRVTDRVTVRKASRRSQTVLVSRVAREEVPSERAA